MADTGWVSPGTVVNDATIGSVAWVNPSNAGSSDNVYTTFTGGSTSGEESHYLKSTNYGFSIPTGATIDGIEVRIERVSDDGTDISYGDKTFFSGGIRIVKGGTISSTDLSDGSVWSTTEQYDVYGSSTQLWGETWSSSDINSSLFGFVVSAVASKGPFDDDVVGKIDNTQIKVYYTEGTPTASVSPITTTLSIPTVTPTYVSNISWYNPSWDYRVKVTVQASQVDADLNNFPIYVDLSYLPAGFHTNVNQTDARDIRVTKADGTTEVPREVVSYDSSTDTGEIHFKGDVSSSTNTDFYIYYGNSGASDYATNATYGAENVWDSNYKAVLHCSQDPSGSAPQIIDSTSNNNDFTSYGTMTTSDLVTGKVGSGIDLDGSDDYLMISDNAGLSGITNLTVQSWVKATTWSTHSFTPIVVKGIGAAGNREWGLYGNNSSQAGQFVARESTATVSNIFGGSLTTSFHQLTGTYDGSTLRIYVDGAQANSLSTSLVVDDRSANVKIGFSESATFRFSGIVDEVRISNTTRSAGWISTEYNNQSSPSTFFSISAQEEAADNTATVSPVATTLSIPTITPVWVFQTTASVSPVSFTLSVVDPTATYVYEQTTSVSPLATTISLPEVVATYIAVLNADISSIELSLVLPTVSATYKEYIADVSPISTSFSIPDVSAIAIFTASTSPILTTFSINSVTAIFYKPWNTSSVSSNNWTDGIINSNNWEKIDEEISNAWSSNNSTSSNWTEPDPG